MRYLAYILLFNIIFCWKLVLTIEDINTNTDAADDFLELGVCENCHDGFHYGEDLSNIPTGTTSYTDIRFFHHDWLGTSDENGNLCCDSPNFSIDLRSISSPSDLLQWNIRGSTVGHDSPLRLTWKVYSMTNWEEENLPEVNILDEISEEYDIYLYVGETKYNLKTESFIDINPDDLSVIYENEQDFIGTDNIKILLGACAESGTTSYFEDSDMDGLGIGPSIEFCPGSQPDNYVENNLDANDSIYCLSNNIDDCDICDGFNSNKDCNGVCFGNAIIDSCGVCDGNESNDLGCGCFQPAPSGCDNSCESTLSVDCNNDCGGQALLDDCNVCSGGNSGHEANSDKDDCGDCYSNNQNCLDEIFSVLPYNLHALIQDDSILISWNFDLILEESYIEGFNIYYTNENLELELINTTEQNFLETNEFNSGVFCISAFDRFNNESENPICITASEYYSKNYVLHEGANLVSFPYIPEDNSINNMLSFISEDLAGIIGEGAAAIYNNNSGQFVGSLNNIEYSKGYWLKVQSGSDGITFDILGFPFEGNLIYELHEGFNLISYSGNNNSPINEVIPVELKQYISNLIGEGEAAIYNDDLNQFVGSLNYIKPGNGYWIKTNTDISFYWQN